MIGQTTTTQIAKDLDAFYDRALIQPLRAAYIYGKYGQQKTIKDNNTIRLSKYPSLGTQTVALTEGVNPSPQRLSKSQITATVSIYGGYVEITEEVDLYTIDPVVAVATERVGWQAFETLDEITRDIIHGGTNYMWAGGASAQNAIDDSVTEADLRKIARALRNTNTPFFKQLVGGTPNVNTTGLNNAWAMIIHPDVLYDMEALGTWTPVNEYSKPETADEYEEGAIGNFRVIATTVAPILEGAGASVGSTGKKSTSSNIDVYQNLILAPDAFGTVRPDSGTQSIRKGPEYGGPLNMYTTVGWKAHFTALIIDDDKMYRYECAASA